MSIFHGRNVYPVTIGALGSRPKAGWVSIIWSHSILPLLLSQAEKHWERIDVVLSLSWPLLDLSAFCPLPVLLCSSIILLFIRFSVALFSPFSPLLHFIISPFLFVLYFHFLSCPHMSLSFFFSFFSFSHTSPGVVADASVLFSSAGSHDTYAVFFLSACFLSLSALAQHSFYSVPPNCFLQPVLCILHTFEFKYCHIM